MRRRMRKRTLIGVAAAGALIGFGLWCRSTRAPESRMPGTAGEDPSLTVRVEQGAAARARYAARVRASAPSPPSPSPSAARPGEDDLARPAPPPAPTEALRYLVEDEDGEPVAGVRARLVLLPGSLAGRAHWPAVATADWTAHPVEDEETIHGESDAHGELHFEDVPWMRRIRIDVDGTDELAGACLFDCTPHPRRATIRLVPAGETLLLRVEGPAARLQGATLVVRRPVGRRFGSVPISRMWAWGAATLDAEGRAVLPRLPAGALVADVIVPGTGMWRGVEIEREGGGHARVDLGRPQVAAVRGVLRGPTGRGVAGARLALAVTPYLRRTPLRSWLRWAVSGPDGAFAFEDVPVGGVEELYVEAEGYVAPRLVLEGAPLRPDEVLEVPLQLIPGRSVVGRVRDASGAPRAGVRVDPSSRAGMVVWDPAAAWTDEEGRYRIDRLPPGTVRLSVGEPAGSARADVEVEVPAGGAPAARAPTAVLAAAAAVGRIEVRVLDAQGEPVSGAWVTLRTKRGNLQGTVQTGPTAPDGRFDLDGIERDTERIEVWAFKGDAVSVAREVSPAAAEAGEARVQLTLPAVGRVRGRVLRAGRPADGMRVAVVDTRLHATCDGEGRFVLRGVPPGWQGVQVRAPDGRDLGAPVRVRVVAGETVAIELDAPAELDEIVLTGRLLDDRGHPLAGVQLEADRAPNALRASRWAGRTGADGAFRVPVPDRGNHALWSGRCLLHPALSAGLEPVDVVFDASRLPVVEGRILGADGKQVACGHVNVTVDGSGREPEAHVAGGFFRLLLPGPPQGEFRVEAYTAYRDRDGREQQARFEPVPFRPGDAVALRVATPEAAGEDGSARGIEGFVVDERGEPVPGARVTVTPRDGEREARSTRSADDGTFTLPELSAGSLRLEVVGPPGYASSVEPVAVAPEAGPVAVTLPRLPDEALFTVRGRVLDLDDLPVAGAPLMLFAPGGTLRSCRTDADGRFEVALLPRGRVAVRLGLGWDAAAYDGEPDAVGGTASPEANDVVLRVSVHRRDPDREYDVPVLLEDPAGEVLPDSSPFVRLRGLGARDGVERRVAPFAFAHGATQALVRSVPDGRYRVEVTLSGIDSPYLPVPSWEIAVPGETIRVVLRRAVELYGTVEGDDLAGYRIRVWGANGTWWVAHPLAAGGAFSFHVDPAETLSVTVHHPDRSRYARLEGVTAEASPLRIALDQVGLEVAGRIEGLAKVPEDYQLRLVGTLFARDLELTPDTRFRVRGVPPGRYRLDFSSFDFSEEGVAGDARQEVEAGNTDVVLHVER